MSIYAFSLVRGYCTASSSFCRTADGYVRQTTKRAPVTGSGAEGLTPLRKEVMQNCTVPLLNTLTGRAVPFGSSFHYIPAASTPMTRNVLIDLFFTVSAHGLALSFQNLSWASLLGNWKIR
jgi:hypothetical protein